MVLIYGDVLMDVLIFEEAPKVYASDAQARALVVPGGSAFNTARHAARCGANAGILGCVGTDGGYGFFYGGWAALRYQYAAHTKGGLHGYTAGAS